MESIKCGVAIGDKTIYDMASLFCRLIIVGQVERQTLFDYELCAVPASIIDEYGCLRTGTTSILASKLKVDDRRWPTTAISHCLAICWVCFRSRQHHEGQTRSVPTKCWSSSIAIMTGQQKIMSESGVQVKGLLTTISQHQGSSHAAMP